jgi:hypothetical protein
MISMQLNTAIPRIIMGRLIRSSPVRHDLSVSDTTCATGIRYPPFARCAILSLPATPSPTASSLSLSYLHPIKPDRTQSYLIVPNRTKKLLSAIRKL